METLQELPILIESVQSLFHGTMRYDVEQYRAKLIHRQELLAWGRSLEPSKDAEFQWSGQSQCARSRLRNISPRPLFSTAPLKERAQQLGGRFASLIAQLVDVGDDRVAAMDAAGVDVQALSLTAPGVEQLDVEEAKSFARARTPSRRPSAIRPDFSAWPRCRSPIPRRR
jgi:hypothetical protein